MPERDSAQAHAGGRGGRAATPSFRLFLPRKNLRAVALRCAGPSFSQGRRI
jgi:hypothetical protein